MENTQPNGGRSRFAVRASADSHFSWIRTRFSLERTLLSYERTAIALLGFGFTIVKFFDYLSTAPGIKPAIHPQIPRIFGLSLIGASVLVLVVSLWQYLWSVAYLKAAPFDQIAPAQSDRMNTPALGICMLLILIGIGAFVAVISRAV